MIEYRAIYKCPLCGKVFESDATLSNGQKGPTASIYKQHQCSDKVWGAALLVGTYEVGAKNIEEFKNHVENSDYGCLGRAASFPMCNSGGTLTKNRDEYEYHIRSDYEKWSVLSRSQK